MQTELEKKGIQNRLEDLKVNTYYESTNEYKVDGSNSKKGTGSGGATHDQSIDIENGGSSGGDYSSDINGIVENKFSGREGNLMLNEKYSKNTPYAGFKYADVGYPTTNINTDENKGQIQIF